MQPGIMRLDATTDNENCMVANPLLIVRWGGRYQQLWKEMEATTDYKEMWNMDLAIVYETKSVQPMIMITAISICSGLFYPTGWAAQPS